MKKSILLIYFISILLAASSCQKESDNTLSRELILGTYELTIPAHTTAVVKVKQGGGSYQTSSNNTEVAKAAMSMSENGVVNITAIAKGEAVITVTDAMEHSKQIKLTVTSQPVELTIDQDTENFQLIKGNMRVVIINTGNGGYKVESSNPDIVKATISEDQVTLWGLSNGKSVVTISDKEDQSISFEVTVADVVDILLDKAQVNIAVTAKAVVKVLYGNGTYKAEVSDPEVASVKITAKTNINITALKEGDVSVTISDSKGQKAQIAIHCYKADWAAYLGSTNYISIPTFDTDYPELTNVSYEAFVCMESAGFLNTVMGTEGNFLIRMNNGTFEVYHQDVSIFGKSRITFGNWYYVVATFDGVNKQLKLYINGNLESSTNLRSSTLNLGRTAGVQSTQYEHFLIGQACEIRRYLYGSIGQVRVWNKTLTEEEIKANNVSISVSEDSPGLIGYWKMNENTEVTLFKDASGNGNDAVPSAVVKQWSPLAYP